MLKRCEEIAFFFQLLVSFDFLKSIINDAIVDIKMIFKFGLKYNFSKKTVILLFDLDQQNTFWLFLTNSKLLDLILLDAK